MYQCVRRFHESQQVKTSQEESQNVLAVSYNAHEVAFTHTRCLSSSYPRIQCTGLASSVIKVVVPGDPSWEKKHENIVQWCVSSELCRTNLFLKYGQEDSWVGKDPYGPNDLIYYNYDFSLPKTNICLIDFSLAVVL